MLVDGFPYYDYCSADILPVDEFSIAISILLGIKSRANRLIFSLTKVRSVENVSSFESFLEQAICAFEELRSQAIGNRQVCGPEESFWAEPLPLDERSIIIALLNNTKIRAELSISNPWGQSILDEGSQQIMDKASFAINAAIEMLKNSQNQ